MTGSLSLVSGLERSDAAAQRWNRQHPDAPPITADDVVSPTGAVGRHQIEPGTAEQYNFDPTKLHDPVYNRNVAGTVLQQLRDRYTDDDGNTDMAKVLIGYNAGPGRADKWNGDPSTLPKQTQDYLTRARELRPDLFQSQEGNVLSFDDLAPKAATLSFDDVAPVSQLPHPNQPESSWGDVLKMAAQNTGARWQALAGGALQMAAETSPQFMPRSIQASEFEPPIQETPQNAADRQKMAKFASGLHSDAEAQIKANSPNVAPGTAKDYANTITSGLIDIVPLLAATTVGGPVIGAELMGAQAVAGTYGANRAAGRSPAQATMDATFSGLVNGGLGVLPLGALMRPGQTFLGGVVHSALSFGAFNVATEALQIGYDKGLVTPDMTLAQAWDRLKTAGITGVLQGAFLGAGEHGLQAAVNRFRAQPAEAPAAAAPEAGAPERKEPTGPSKAPVKPQAGIPSTGAIPEYARGTEPTQAPSENVSQLTERPSAAIPGSDDTVSEVRGETRLPVRGVLPEVPERGAAGALPQAAGRAAETPERGQGAEAPSPAQKLVDKALEPTAPPAERPVGGGIPNFDAEAPPPVTEGRAPIDRRDIAPDVAVTASGREVPVHYAVVEADHLVPSQTLNGNPNPIYPQELQPRDRSRAVSSQQIADTAQNLDPRLLDRMPMASHGAPIISADGVVESGNGRTLAVQAAYENGIPTADGYRDYLAQQGYPVDGMRKPMLVRVRMQDMTPDERQAFTREANESGTMGMSATERATTDAAALPDSALDLFHGGDVDLARNRPFVRRFMDSAVGKSEHAGMIGPDGEMSQDAIRRVQGALLAKAFGDPKLIASIIEAPDANIQAIGGALTDTAAEWAKMRSAARAGEIPANMDQTRALLDAVRIVRHARTEGRNVAEYVGQKDIFAGNSLDPDAEGFLRLMFRNTKDWTQPVGRDKLAEALGFYVTEATKAGVGTDLLGESAPEPSRILALAKERQYPTREPATPSLFGPKPAGDGPSVRPPGGEGTGPGAEGPAAGGGAENARIGRAVAPSFPDVIVQRGAASATRVTKMPDYKKAKAGDVAAALHVVEQGFLPAKMDAIKDLVAGGHPTLVAVHAEEAEGRNAIPQAYATFLGEKLGLPVDTDIVQTTRSQRTGAKAEDQMANRVGFDGKVEPGKSYLLVDDHVTQGGTLADLASHIEANGGHVVGATTLTESPLGHQIMPKPGAIEALRKKFGPELESWWKDHFGNGFDALTASEARYLGSISSADAVRNRFAKRTQEAGAPAGAAAPSPKGPIDFRSREREVEARAGLPKTPNADDRAGLTEYLAKAEAAAKKATNPEERETLERAADWAHGRIQDADWRALTERLQPVMSEALRLKKGAHVPAGELEVSRDPQTGLYHSRFGYNVSGFAGGGSPFDEGFRTAREALDQARARILKAVDYEGRRDSSRTATHEATMDKIRAWAEGLDVPPTRGAPPQEGPTREETIESLAKKGYGDKNTIFTKDAADKAREIIRQKLQAGKRIAGDESGALDPEIMHAGFTLAGYHVEAGARAFADFAKAMINDLGEDVRPFLKMWYNAVRDYPEFDAAGMTPGHEITPEAIANVSGSRTNLERDRERPSPPDQIRQEAVPPEAGGAEPGARAGGEAAGGEPRGETEGGERVPDRGAATVGKPGDSELQAATSAAAGDLAQPDGPQRSAGHGSAGIPPDRLGANTVAGPAEDAGSVGVSAPADIRRALPSLFPEQQDDVAFAEERFGKGHGVLFTNGTGTGKTYTGAGIAKRFWDRGKQNILIVAPSHGILSHWQEAMQNVGTPFNILESTATHGKGPVGTTYANLGQNKALADRDWDLVIADESHNLMSQADANETANLRAFRAITKRPEELHALARMRLRAEADPIDQLQEHARFVEKQQGREAAKPLWERWSLLNHALEQKIKPMVEQLRGAQRSKAAFLSATPFAYDKNVDYGNGYLFDYGPEPQRGGYNQPSAKDAFFMQHFGYRMRYGKLTKPDSAVESDIMERGFHEWLRKEGALAGRVLNVDKDYDRKFVLMDDGVGHKIDNALEFLQTADDGKFRPLADTINKRFDYLSRMRLLEAIKANHFVPIIQKHMDMGRKVVVFHDFNQGGGFSPFEYSPEMEAQIRSDGHLSGAGAKALHDEFLARNPYVRDIDEGFRNMRSPIETMKKAFPDAVIYNGTVPKKLRESGRLLFNRDAGPSGKHANLIVVQSAAGQAGISLHDTTGRHQRVLINLGMPGRPTTAIQEEGRTYRIGQASNAPFRYGNTGTNWERFTFANRLAERAGTAENLALGDRARRLRDSFVDAFNDSGDYPPSADDGVGGKEADKRSDRDVTDFDRAKTYYFAQSKKTSRDKSREGVDYFPTPEPVGLKMVEFANLRPGESVLEPSAGHGAISRFFPETNDRTLIEPATELASRAALSSPGAKVLNQRFEDLHAVNKYDAVVMNPPFGVGGKTAMEHLARGANHLKDGGRVVAIIPEGPSADGRFEKFMESPEAKNIYLRSSMKLPPVTFERAGTQARARIVVLERQNDPVRAQQVQQTDRDYSDADTIKELFNRIEDASLPDRLRPPKTPEQEAALLSGRGGKLPEAPKAAEFKTGETKHSKTGEPLFVASLSARVPRESYDTINSLAKKHGGYYSTFKGSGAIPGFQFKSADARAKFMAEFREPPSARQRPKSDFSEQLANGAMARNDGDKDRAIAELTARIDSLRAEMAQASPKQRDNLVQQIADRQAAVDSLRGFATEPGATDMQGNALPQTIMPGMEGSDRERLAAEIARREGRGKLEAKRTQKAPDVGLFARPGETGPETGSQGSLFQRAKHQIAYHGSPFEFDRFEDRAIGSGEGTQAYGHGHYFAGVRDVAEYYRHQQTSRTPGAYEGRSPFTVKGEEPPRGQSGHMAMDTAIELDHLLSSIKNRQPEAVEHLKQTIEGRIAQFRRDMAVGRYRPGSAVDHMEAIANYYDRHVRPGVSAADIEQRKGALYTVELAPKEDEWLDRDKPLSEQSPGVREKLRMAGIDLRNEIAGSVRHGGDVYNELAQHFGGARMASHALKQMGIPGLRYSDMQSRLKAAQEGRSDRTHNYVLFDPEHAQIKTKEQRAPTDIEKTGRIRSALGEIEALAMQHGINLRTPRGSSEDLWLADFAMHHRDEISNEALKEVSDGKGSITRESIGKARSQLQELDRTRQQFGKKIGGGYFGGEERLAEDTVGYRPDVQLTDKERALHDEVAKIAKKIVPGAEVRMMRALEGVDPTNAQSRGERIWGSNYGPAFRRAIAWSMESPDAVGTMRHEAVHWLLQAGLISKPEWDTLREAAQKFDWIGKHQIASRYPDLDHDGQLEEAIADEFGVWRRGNSRVPAGIHAIFRKIGEFLAQLGDHLRRAFGADATPEDIFRRIERGEVGARAPAEAREMSRAAQQRPKKQELEEIPRSEVHGPIARPINRMLGEGANSVGRKLSDAIERYVPEPWRDLGESIKRGIAPMATGSPRARADAKDFANAMRAARYEWGRVDDYLAKKYTPAERKAMWDAADEESVLRQQGKEPADGQGLGKLSPEQRADVEELQARANDAFQTAKRMGMTKAEGLPSYVPRMVVLMTAEGARAPGQAGRGNLRTTTSQLLHRKYLEAGETEEAAKARLGESAAVVHDIRTLGLATGKLHQAIAGRALIDRIKTAGDSTGEKTVHEGVTNHPEDYFTMDHPAFRQWRPEFVKNEQGKVVPRRDEAGQIVFKAQPLYVSKEYQGPLSAVLSRDTSEPYKFLMDLKGRMMSGIMYSPVMHNAVIWGKAIPAAPRKVLGFSVYFDGNKAKNDPATMREALNAGLDPVGRRYFNQDISAIVEGPQIAPGRSWTSQVLAAIPNLYSREAGDAVKRAIDQAGDVWHNKFLWDRVGDLQMGLYTTIRDSGIKKGMDPLSAQRLAAHFANRYAGSLPMESMSKMARQTANLMLFSRSFTLGNAGAWKDSVMGLPRDVQAQVLRDRGVPTLNAVQGEARRKALSMLVMDIALSKFGLLLAAGAAYGVRRMLNQPGAFQTPGQNEPGKEQRFFMGYGKDGEALYGRLPTGKVGEELWDWVTEPRDLFLRKLSPYGQIAYAVAANDKGFGRKLFDPYSATPAALGQDALNIGNRIADSVAPMGLIDGIWDLAAGKGDTGTVAAQTLLPAAGITVSKGFPGGPAQGEINQAKQEHDYQVQQAMPGIRDQIRTGDIAGARARMHQLGMPPGLINFYIRSTRNPAMKPSASEMRNFRRYATPEETERVQQDISQ